MHGKAQHEPARHSVVLDCKLVPLHDTCQSLPAVHKRLLHVHELEVDRDQIHVVRLAVSPNATI